jgi:hypothetical protein
MNAKSNKPTESGEHARDNRDNRDSRWKPSNLAKAASQNKIVTFEVPNPDQRKPNEYVTLKSWEKGLQQEDWDFSCYIDWPKHALCVAWLWELERELGRAGGPFYPQWKLREWKRIQKRPDSAELKGWQPKPPVEPKPIMHSHVLTQVASLVSPNVKHYLKEVEPDFSMLRNRYVSAYTRIHALEIDWNLSEKALVDCFRNWLRDGEHEFPTDRQGKSRERRGKRQTAGYLSWLRELSIYRISSAGIPRSEGLKRLGGRESPSNWEHAQSRTLERVGERLRTLVQLAHLWQAEGVNVKSWREQLLRWYDLDNPW